MLSNIHPFLAIITTLLLTTSLFSLNCAQLSQILDCTNSTEPSSCYEQAISLENNIGNKIIIGENLSNFAGRRETNEVCANHTDNGAASLICSSSSQAGQNSSEFSHVQRERSRKLIEVFIRTPNNNATQFDPGASLTIECRFHVDNSSLSQDFRFKLKWMRSVVGAQNNQSITTTETDSSLTIIAATTRLWTVQRNGGLDLELNDFQEDDTGNYFCQALASETGPIISEAHVRLTINKGHNKPSSLVYDESSGLVAEEADSLPPYSFYSQENLSKLLPSLKVVPQFTELAAGETIQLICLTSHLDPDPEPNTIEWNFEAIETRRQLMHKSPIVSAELPYNVSVLGNVLIVWSMSKEHCGIYKCSVKLSDFNLTVQAAGELVLRPTVDTAPLVFVSPEIVRLSPNGSARIQCEATGYPPPEVAWYRVESMQQTNSYTQSTKKSDGLVGLKSSGQIVDENFTGDSCIEFEQIPYKDAILYCDQNKCQSGSHHRSSITGVSMIHLKQARAHHQGQWVCRASNKHGSNQASSLVDVEFRERPVVVIVPELSREQTIVLSDNGDSGSSAQQARRPNATFKCSIESGKPQPRLRWLRTTTATGATRAGNDHQQLSASNNLDIYDLTRVSSATSNVSTHLEDQGRSLVLVLGTISHEDEGDYICLGENEWGRHSAVAHLTVRRPTSVRILQMSPMVAQPNSSFHLDCLATGHPSPVDIEWSRYDRGAFFSLISRSSSGPSSSGYSDYQGGQGLRAVLKFDRVGAGESGEYTCNARDPLNGSLILRDTIMVLVEDGSAQKVAPGEWHTPAVQQATKSHDSLLPKLMVRPTKVTATLGSNVTLDCLAVSGLQPTVVEWIAPPPQPPANLDPTIPSSMESSQLINHAINGSGRSAGGGGLVWSYYRAGPTDGRMVQFGSKLRILNVSKQHEGVYQCKGSNKIGVENAPALIRVLDSEDDGHGNGNGTGNGTSSVLGASPSDSSSTFVAKTKVAKVGSNIELKCQVNGVEQPATSWSRDGLELPASSVQIEHNLWIQNVSHKDSGLYICSARSKQPNKVIQARINLLVSGQLGDSSSSSSRLYNLTAKIVASKNAVSVADSITLECIVISNGGPPLATVTQLTGSEGSTDLQAGNNNNNNNNRSKAVDLEEIERNVIWTNKHTGQSVFQDNVYVQQNLLIIYDLRAENSATYRCNYDDFTHYTDYRLQVAELSEFPAFPGKNNGANITSLNPPTPFTAWATTITNSSDNNLLIGSYGHLAQVKQATLGGHLTLECPPPRADGVNPLGAYRWTRGEGAGQRAVGPDSAPLVFEPIRTGEADIYRCYHYNHQAQKPATGADGGVDLSSKAFSSFIVQVLVPVARFAQKPVSFVSLPSISGANQQLEMELKFLPERDHGLILFNGQRQWNRSAVGDYISLGLNKGFLEFRFELGDGTTLLRSLQSLTLNQWHQVIIERNRRGAVMWLDKQPPVSNSSSGKFFNLNLDSVLYVGGNQYFLNKSRQINATAAAAANQTSSMGSSSHRFYGYSRGFQGCISLLRIGQNEINLISRNRSVSMGIYECDKPECRHSECGGGICQVDRMNLSLSSNSSIDSEQHHKFSSSSPSFSSPLASSPDSSGAGKRCICPPGFVGEHCESKLPPTTNRPTNFGQQSKATASSSHGGGGVGSSSTTTMQTVQVTFAASTTQSSSTLAAAEIMSNGTAFNFTSSGAGRACELLNPCSPSGTQSCQTLTSTSFKCHCRLGFMGDTCSQVAIFSNETSLWFNQQAYLQFRFNRPEEVQLYNHEKSNLGHHQPAISSSSSGGGGGNNSNTLQQTSNLTNFARLTSMAESQSISFKLQTKSSYGLIFYMGQANSLLDPTTNSTIIGTLEPGLAQTSKSMVANLLARLSTIVFDYLAIALVDGHVELSFELGSGVAIIRSSQRVNDGSMHQIRVVRSGRSARLTIDELHKYEGSSPGKLSMLNSPADIYLGGLPYLAELTHNMYMSGFVGCVLNLEINSLGPINLIHSDHLTQVRSARNLAPCPANGDDLPTTVPHTTGANPISPATNISTTSPTSPLETKHKPYQAPAQPESDDPDEM